MSGTLYSWLLRLLSRVHIGWRLAIAMAVLLVPLALLSYHYVQDKVQAIESARLARSGLEYVEPLHQFMRHMADHRGMTHLYLLGNRAVLSEIRAAQTRIDQDLAALAIQDARMGRRLKAHVKAVALQSVWSNFKGVAQDMPAADSFALHTAVIAAALELNDHVAETSGMVTGPRTETLYLMDAIVLRGPRLAEKIGQLRGGASGLVQRGSLSTEEQMDIAAQIAGIREQFVAIQHSLDKAYYYLPPLEEEIMPNLRSAERSLFSFLGQAELLTRNHVKHPDPLAFFAIGTASLNAYNDLDTALDEAFERRIHGVIADLESDEQAAIMLVAGTMAVALLISVVIVRSVSVPVRHLMQVVDRLSRNEDQARAEIDTVDEIGVLARQFNRMMDERAEADAVLRESEARYKSLTEISSDVYWEQDENLLFTRVLVKTPETALAQLNYVSGKARWDLPESMPLSGTWADHQALLAARLPFRDFEFRYRSYDDRIHYASISGAPLFGADGCFRGYHGVSRDITEQKLAEQRIRDSEANLAAAQHIARIGSWEVDVSNPGKLDNPVRWSDEVFRIMGYQPGEIEPTAENFYKAVHPADREEVIVPVNQLLRDGTRYTVEHRILRPDGSERIVQEKGEILNDPVTGRPAKVLGTMQDITERKQVEQQLAYLAQFDTLTELPNRHMFYDRLSQVMAMTLRSGARIACMFLDLDRFKSVNDTFGHAVGDKLLLEVARRLRQCVRSDDIIGRLGGDEFAVVLAHLTKAEDASVVAQKMVTMLTAAFQLDGHEAHISASIGIAIYPGDGTDADELLRNADTAMYRAKEQGRSNHQFYLPQMNERLAQRQQLETSLRGAAEREEFLLYYQPKVELTGGAISGFEALLRWQHPQRGLVSPTEFVSILEDTELIVPVGEWVLRTVCAQIKAWQARGLVPPPIAVNISARQFQEQAMDALIASIADIGIDPTLIKLELTESLLMKEAEGTARTLAKLKASGVQLSVDDFGTGYSSLAYLKRFPLDEIKIDRAFIREVTSSPEDAEITLTIINLAHSLNLKAVAEGVESEAQLNFLRAHGCDEIQGYYFARPLSVDDATRLLREDRRLVMPKFAESSEDQPVLLLLDDSPTDLELMQRALRPSGYEILTADNPRAAFELLTKHRVSIVVSDQNMPGMSGVKFLARVHKLYPRAVRIVLSGSNDPDAVTDAVNEAGVHKYLSKDWEPARIRVEVREAHLKYRQQIH